MKSSRIEGSNKNADNDVSESANICEGEINLMDYFRVLWKRKGFIFSTSVLPALLAGLTVFLWPRDYNISYIYDMELGKKDIQVLEEYFYSTENQEKFIEKLREGGFDEYAQKAAESRIPEDLKELISFGILPSYLEVFKPSKTVDFEELQKIQQIKGSLLVMQIGTKSRANIQGIAQVCRKNFEQVLPLYSVKEGLDNKIISIKSIMADIEETRYNLNLQLERKKSNLEKLKISASEVLDKLPSDVVLQFNNVNENTTVLPLANQVQAAESQIINLEDQIRANKENYDYYTDLLELNGKLCSHLEKSMSSYYTLEQFHAFLNEMPAEFKEDQQQLQDYLSAYTKRIENRMAKSNPLVETPPIYPVPKGTARASALVFAVAVMISVFAAFLLEQRKETQNLTS